MSRCKKCRHFPDYPMSCKDCESKFPFCGFQQRTKIQVEIERIAEDLKNRRNK